MNVPAFVGESKRARAANATVTTHNTRDFCLAICPCRSTSCARRWAQLHFLLAAKLAILMMGRVKVLPWHARGIRIYPLFRCLAVDSAFETTANRRRK
jgi:hypothetical protein